MRELPSQDMLRQLLLYNPETGKLFWLPRSPELFVTRRAYGIWNARYPGTEAFTATCEYGYKIGAIYDRTMKAHRVIWCIVTGEWPAHEVDHINGDRSDNRFRNLRAVSRQENRLNVKERIDNTSGRTGVHFHKNSKKWYATIKVAGKSRHLGVYATFEEASQARAKAEKDAGFHPNHGRKFNGDDMAAPYYYRVRPTERS